MLYEKNIKIQDVVKKERLKQGLSRAELANMIGCTERSIAYWEKKQKVITIEMADKALKALGVSITLGKEKEQ